MQTGLNLIEGNEALTGQQHRVLPKDQLAAMGFGADGNPDGPLEVVGMHLIVGTVNLAGRLEQGGVKHRG